MRYLLPILAYIVKDTTPADWLFAIVFGISFGAAAGANF